MAQGLALTYRSVRRGRQACERGQVWFADQSPPITHLNFFSGLLYDPPACAILNAAANERRYDLEDKSPRRNKHYVQEERLPFAVSGRINKGSGARPALTTVSGEPRLTVTVAPTIVSVSARRLAEIPIAELFAISTLRFPTKSP
jgi:hypothetical protein